MQVALPFAILALPFLVALVELLRTPKPVSEPRVVAPRAIAPGYIPASVTEPNGDLVAYLLYQHQEIKALFNETLVARGSARVELFFALRKLLATHEATEEELIHPAVVAALGAEGRRIADARIEEEKAAATTITQIEKLNVHSFEFELQLRRLQKKVVLHAAREEREEFGVLAGAVYAPTAKRLRSAAHASYRDAPAHPHAYSRDVGPFVAMLNHTRDILAGNESLEGDGDLTRPALASELAREGVTGAPVATRV